MNLSSIKNLLGSSVSSTSGPVKKKSISTRVIYGFAILFLISLILVLIGLATVLSPLLLIGFMFHVKHKTRRLSMHIDYKISVAEIRSRSIKTFK